MAWRVAQSLLTLRDQLNARYPARSKASDGFIGDAAHQAEGSASDHNPWVIDAAGTGVVTAFDITHDPEHGLDIDELSDVLAASRDNRIKYIIANQQIMAPVETGWVWMPYKGIDPHTNHLHLSVNVNNYDDSRQWKIGGSMAVITMEAVVALCQAVTGRQPANAEETQYINKEATQENLDGLITYWAGKSRVPLLERVISDLQAAQQTTTTQAPLNKEAIINYLQGHLQ